MSDHRLVDNCVRLERVDGVATGIAAECICGWKSVGHFSGMGASAAFQDHQESMPIRLTPTGDRD